LDTSQAGELALLAALVVLAAFFAGSEVAFLGVARTRVRQLAETGSRLARLLLSLQERRAVVLATMLVGITGSYYVAEHLATVLGISVLGETWGPAVALAAMTLVVLVFAEATPMQFAARNTERVALYSAPLVGLASAVLYPLVALLALVARGLLYLVGVRADTILPTVTEEQLKAMIEEGESQGALGAGTRRMLHGALDFGDQTAAQVMTPRPDMICVEENTSLSEALATAIEEKHSRLPVYAGDRDHITGILYTKDILPYLRLGQMDAPVKVAARPAHYVPESLPADQLLRQLQTGRRVIAIVLDEFGGTAGLVTVEDLLEEIVGDIQDEYDVEQPEIVAVNDHCFVCDASMGMHELDNLVGEELPTEDHDSLGGLVLEIAGRIPEVGESFRRRGLTFTVEEMDGPRISRVRVVETIPEGMGEEAPESL
jgi:putative hemolysin